ncbi:helix-turn-helix transcriptional regulator [Pseudonocardia broussonetiae]|nr:AraC family transcriptional regulator [Pseudonocardia broussonetiae]
MRTVRMASGGRRVPVYGFTAGPAGPRVLVHRIGGDHARVPPGEHAHDFFLVTYVGHGSGRVAGPGDLFVVAPGDVVGPTTWGGDPEDLHGVAGWSVMFDADVLGAQPAASPLAWGAHPLLAPFVGGRPSGTTRMAVPPDARPDWERRFALLEAELRERRDGHHAAATAHLTLLLVDVARLAVGVEGGVVADLRLNREPLLGDVFAVIEQRYAEPLSLRDVAAAVGLSPGHLTTRVRDRTGRTVLEWITERRMLEARRLLASTDSPVAAVGRAVGFPDAGYFARVFRREHGTTPGGWRGRA